MRSRFVAAVAASTLFAAACGGSSAPDSTAPRARTPITTTLSPEDLTTTTTKAPVEIPVGFFVYDGDGFDILMPERWTVAGFGDVDLQAILDEISGAGVDELIPAIQAAFAQGGKMFAFDFENSTADFANNINVLRLDPPGVAASDLVGLAEKDFRRIGAKNIEGRVEWLPAGQSVIVTYELPAELGGAEGLSYTVLTSASQWVITYTATEVASFQPSFEMMMDSFRER